MREQRLKAEMGVAKKEQSFYEEKRMLSKKLEKIEEKRAKDISKMEKKIEGTEDQAELTKIEAKKAKNLEKMFKYQQKNKREFKQREPIVHDHFKAKKAKK